LNRSLPREALGWRPARPACQHGSTTALGRWT